MVHQQPQSQEATFSGNLPWGEKWNCECNPKADASVKTLIGPAFEVGDGTDNSRLGEALTIVISTLREVGFFCEIKSVTTELIVDEKEFIIEQLEMGEVMEVGAHKGDVKVSFCAHGILPTWVELSCEDNLGAYESQIIKALKAKGVHLTTVLHDDVEITDLKCQSLKDYKLTAVTGGPLGSISTLFELKQDDLVIGKVLSAYQNCEQLNNGGPTVDLIEIAGEF